ncbi:unnamed protein product [Diatraea saccharalis]|uniref:Gag-like protein n=1 Tax=Diatraea saccharalis TaxID=40085 RepID=A0A9N9RAT1_9NEOP|nr:unnamed protein product [Diatraea saccharalis]
MLKVRAKCKTNDELQKGKAALENAGNMKRERKITALESLQTLYEIVLSLSDSRSRHKYNLEVERSRHAKELVRVERAHIKALQDTVRTTSAQLQRTKQDIAKVQDDTNAIRNWLGYETKQPYENINKIEAMVRKLENTMADYTSTSKNTEGVKSQKTSDCLTEVVNKIYEETKKLSNQFDELRRGISEARAELQQQQQQTRAEINTSTETLKNSVLAKTEESTQHIITKLEAECKISREHLDNWRPLTPPTIPAGQGDALFAEENPPRGTGVNRPFNIIAGRSPHLRCSSAGALIRHPQPQRSYPPPRPIPNYTVIVSSSNPKNTGENILDEIREALDTKSTGARAQIPKTNKPLVVIKDVLAYHKEEDIVVNIMSQNKHILGDLGVDSTALRVKYRRKARNPLECHPVLEVPPEVHKKLIEAEYIYIGLQKRPVQDQSPLVQCTKCLGYGHTKTLCTKTE